MFRDQSYGVVPVKKEGACWNVFLVRHRSGHWTLPKGHAEKDETPLESAKRELFEETGLHIVTLLFAEPLSEEYQFKSGKMLIHKGVDYYIAEVAGEVKIQIEEIQEGRWVDFAEGQNLATYPQMKALLAHVLNMLA